MVMSDVRTGRGAATDTSKRRLVAACALLLAALAVVVLRSKGTTGGDPGGRILASLRPALSAVPSGSTVLSVHEHPSSYSKKCPDNRGGRSGWDYVAVVTTFHSALNPSAVLESVGHNLETQGWKAVAIEWDHNAWQLAPAAEWAKAVAHGKTAHAVVYQYPEGFGEASGSWYLNANAQPPGFALAGC
jgi:hypothetical protein